MPRLPGGKNISYEPGIRPIDGADINAIAGASNTFAFNYLLSYPGDTASVFAGTGDVTTNVQNFLIFCQREFYQLNSVALMDQTLRAGIRAYFPPGKYNVSCPIIVPRGVILHMDGAFVRVGSSGTVTSNYTGDTTTKALANQYQPCVIVAVGGHIHNANIYANSNGSDNGSGCFAGKNWVPKTILIGVAGGGYQAGDVVSLAQPNKAPYVTPQVTINTVNASGVPLTVTLSTAGSYDLPPALQASQWSGANGWGGATAAATQGAVFDANGFFLTTGGHGSGLTIIVSAWQPDWAAGNTQYYGGAGLIGDTAIEHLRVIGAGTTYDGVNYGSMFGFWAQGFNFQLFDHEINGGNVTYNFASCSDVRASNINTVNGVIGMSFLGSGDIAIANAVFDTHTNYNLQIDKSDRIKISGQMFFRGGGGTYNGASIQIGANSDAADLNTGIDLDFLMENTGQTIVDSAISLAYIRASNINLKVSNWYFPGVPASNIINTYATFGAGVDTSVNLTGIIDSVPGSLFSGSIPPCGIDIWDSNYNIAPALSTATFGGTAKTGSTLNLIFTNALCQSWPQTAVYTDTTGNTTTQMAAGMVAAINAGTNITNAGVVAVSTAAVVTIRQSGIVGNNTVITGTVSGTNTGAETITGLGTMAGGLAGAYCGPNSIYNGYMAGAPTSGTSGSGYLKAGIGSTMTDYTNGNVYINTAAASAPSWAKVTHA